MAKPIETASTTPATQPAATAAPAAPVAHSDPANLAAENEALRKEVAALRAKTAGLPDDPRYKLGPKPKAIKKGATDLGPPSTLVLRAPISVSKKNGYGGTGKALHFATGEYLPQGFPADLIETLKTQTPCPVWDLKAQGPWPGPLPSEMQRAPGVGKKGTIVPVNAAGKPEAFVDLGYGDR